MTMEVIQHIELGSAQLSIEFTSIPTGYTDLMIKVSGRATDDRGGISWSDLRLRFNGSTSGYTWRYLDGNGSTVGTDGNAGQPQIFAGGVPDAGTTSNTFGNTEIYIPNYRSSVAKSASLDIVTENNATQSQQMLMAGLWDNSAAITSVLLTMASGNLAAGSSATLYGIRRFNTTLSPKATGGAISYDSVNNKWVHAFYTSGTFTPTENLTGVEYLVIAGGGGGGADAGGGGGAGGYRSSVVGESSGGGASAESTMSLTSSTNYTVTVGAGGTSGGSSANPTSGSNSSFNGITAVGGGYGHDFGLAAASGGSGGGGNTAFSNPTPGSGTANQGYAGGAGGGSSWVGSGGGGGAGAVGGNASSSSDVGGNGGVGVSSSITGSAIVRAGGGGGGGRNGVAGGSGGNGGGGSGQGTAAATAGQPNTGGGGGGAHAGQGFSALGAAGGSGVVIIRYSA